MIYLSPGNKWSIPTVLNEIKNQKYIEFLYRDELGRIQKGKQNKKLMFKTILRCGTKCTHCKKEGLHFELFNNYLRIATIDGFLNVEHIIPKSLGGTDIEYNVTIFCNKCNTAKGNNLLVPNKNIPKIKKDKNISNISNISNNTIRFGAFLKKILINKINHSQTEVLFKNIYNTKTSFKINIKNLNKYINKFNTYSINNDIGISISITDFPQNWSTNYDI